MPRVKVKGKYRHFPYTKAGRRAAARLRYRLSKKKR